MNNTQENYYRVIKPYESNLLHTSSSLMGGAAKCYKECKKVSPYTSSFSVMHMKTKEIYNFDVNNKNMMSNMIGGGDPTNQVVTNTEIKSLQTQIDSLINRVKTLEDKLINVTVPDTQNQMQNPIQSQLPTMNKDESRHSLSAALPSQPQTQLNTNLLQNQTHHTKSLPTQSLLAQSLPTQSLPTQSLHTQSLHTKSLQNQTQYGGFNHDLAKRFI
jgi:hypothetical protein